MKNRISVLFAGALIILAGIGIAGTLGRLAADPSDFIMKIAIFVLIGFAIYFLYRRFSGARPDKKEQRAFLKAARKSRKRNEQRHSDSNGRNVVHGALASLRKPKKKAQAHLKVIEGKKGKKKNRVSF